MKTIRTAAFVILAMLPIILNIALGGKPISKYRQWSASKMKHADIGNGGLLTGDTAGVYYVHNGR